MTLVLVRLGHRVEPCPLREMGVRLGPGRKGRLLRAPDGVITVRVTATIAITTTSPRAGAAVERAQAEGRFLDEDTDTVVISLWAQMHGVVTLEEQGLLQGVDPLAAAYATVRGWLAGSPHA